MSEKNLQKDISDALNTLGAVGKVEDLKENNRFGQNEHAATQYILRQLRTNRDAVFAAAETLPDDERKQFALLLPEWDRMKQLDTEDVE